MENSQTKISVNEVGICVKDFDLRISFQNDICEKFCGNLTNKVCNKYCVEGLLPPVKAKQTGIIRDRVVDINGEKIRIVLISDGLKLTTLQLAVSQTLIDDMKRYENYGLTNAELNVVNLRLYGYTNREISEKCFISPATVKSHINHILAKLPEDLAERLKGTN